MGDPRYRLRDNVLSEAQGVWEALAADQSHFSEVVQRARGVQIPPPGSLVGNALVSVPSVLSEAEAGIAVNRNVLSTIADHFAVSHQAATQNELDNEAKVKQIWHELGTTGPGMGNMPPPGTKPFTKEWDRQTPSQMARIPRDLNKGSYDTTDFIMNIVKLGGMWAGTPPTRRQFINKVTMATDIGHICTMLDGKLEPMMQVGDAFGQLAEGYGLLRTLTQHNRYVLFGGWEGKAAEGAQQFFDKLEEWYANDVLMAFAGVHGKWTNYGQSLHILYNEIADLVVQVMDKLDMFNQKVNVLPVPDQEQVDKWPMNALWEAAGVAVAKNKVVAKYLQIARVLIDVTALINAIITAANPQTSLNMRKPW